MWEGDHFTPEDPYETQKMRIFSVTWNLHGKLPKDDEELEILLRAKSIHHDIFVIATQECMRQIAAAVIAPSKAKWETVLQNYFGENFIMVSGIALGATHLAVFVHITLIPIISNVKSDCIATGLSNVVGNKGGIGISFNIGKSSLLFISSHLAAGHEEVERRNQDFNKIFKSLVLHQTEENKKSSCMSPSTTTKIKKNMVAAEESMDRFNESLTDE